MSGIGRRHMAAVGMTSALILGALASVAPAAAQDEPVSMTMWVTADGISKTTVESMFLEYQADHPSVSLTVEEFPFLDMHDKLTIALQSGSGAPDVAYAEISRFGSLLKGDIGLVDLTDLLAATGADLVPARQNNYTYKGRAYGVGLDADPVVLYYRPDLFEAAGITTPIATWDEYVAAGKLLKDKTGADMMSIEWTDYDVWTPIMLQFGGGFFDTEGKVILDNDANRKAFTFMVDLVHKDGIAIAAPGTGTQYEPAFWTDYTSDKVASLWGADWMASLIKAFAGDAMSGKWAAQPLPTGEGAPWRTSTVGGTAMVITKQSQHQDAAWGWVEWLSTERPPDTPVGGVTNNRRWWTEEYYGVPDPYFGGQKLGDLWLEMAGELFKPGAPYLNPDPNNPTAYDIFTRSALGPAITGQMSADDALNAAAAELRTNVGQ